MNKGIRKDTNHISICAISSKGDAAGWCVTLPISSCKHGVWWTSHAGQALKSTHDTDGCAFPTRGLLPEVPNTGQTQYQYCLPLLNSVYLKLVANWGMNWAGKFGVSRVEQNKYVSGP